MRSLRLPTPALTRSWVWFLRGFAVLGILVALRHLPASHVYVTAWTGNSPALAMPWSRFSAAMGERELQAMVPLPLRCISEDKAANGLGDRVCYAPVSAVDGVSALTVAFFFDAGALRQAVVHVPWWSHHAMARTLAQGLGAPAVIQERGGSGGRLVQWRLANGSVNFNRDPGWDPLAWSAVMWTPLQPATSALPARPPG